MKLPKFVIQTDLIQWTTDRYGNRKEDFRYRHEATISQLINGRWVRLHTIGNKAITIPQEYPVRILAEADSDEVPCCGPFIKQIVIKEDIVEYEC